MADAVADEEEEQKTVSLARRLLFGDSESEECEEAEEASMEEKEEMMTLEEAEQITRNDAALTVAKEVVEEDEMDKEKEGETSG